MNYEAIAARQRRLWAAYERATRENALHGAAPRRALGESVEDWAVRVGCDLTAYGAAPSDVVWDDARYQAPAPQWTSTPPSEPGAYWVRVHGRKSIMHTERLDDGRLYDRDGDGREGPTELAAMTAYLRMQWWPVKLEPPP